MSPIVNLQLVVKCKKRSFHSFKVEVALLRYIVFYCEFGCDTSEPHASYISRACSSLVRQPYYAPNCIILKISGLVVVLTVRKVHWAGRASNQPSGLLLSARVPTSRNVYRGDFRFCRIHPRASCRVVWKYSLGVMPYSFLKARKKWL